MHRCQLHQQNITHQPAEFLQERGRILPFHPEAVKQRNRCGSVMRADLIEQLQRPPVAGKSDSRIDFIHTDLSVGRTLIEHAQCIAHTTLGKACQQRSSIGSQVKLLLLSNFQKIFRKLLRLDTPETVPLAAGKYRSRYFLKLRCSKDEKQVLGRLFQNFQKGIESAGGEHMDFVYDINALLHHGRRENCLFPKRPYIVNPVVGRGIELYNIHHGALCNGTAGSAFTAGIPVLRVFAVYCLCQNTRTGRFTRAANPGEEIGMRKAPRNNLVAERIGDMLLADHVIKRLRPPLAIQCLIHLRSPFR